MYELKKIERYLRVNLLGPGPRLMEKRIYRAAVSQRLRNTALNYFENAVWPNKFLCRPQNFHRLCSFLIRLSNIYIISLIRFVVGVSNGE